MAKIINTINLDTARMYAYPAVFAKQYDVNSRFIKIIIQNRGENIDVMPTSKVIFNILREDGESKGFFGAVNSDGSVTVQIPSWGIEVAGLAKADVTIIDSEGRKLTTASFYISVEEKSFDGDEITEDDNYDVLVVLLKEVSEAKENADLVVEKAEEAKTTAEGAAAEAAEKAAAAGESAAAAKKAEESTKEALKGYAKKEDIKEYTAGNLISIENGVIKGVRAQSYSDLSGFSGNVIATPNDMHDLIALVLSDSNFAEFMSPEKQKKALANLGAAKESVIDDSLALDDDGYVTAIKGHALYPSIEGVEL